MSKKESLPAVVHDHFRKANALHGYVLEHLGEATRHALQTGCELSAAKKEVPHGKWGIECERLFDGSLRTAQFYMRFASDYAALKSAEKSALLMLETTLDGAAKAARKAAKIAASENDDDDSPEQQTETVEPPPTYEPPDTTDEPEINGAQEKAKMDHPDGAMVGAKCPNCLDYGRAVDWWHDGACGCCGHPIDAPSDSGRPPASPSPVPEPQAEPEKPKGRKGKPKPKLDRSAYYRQWEQQIGPLVRLVDKIAAGVGQKHNGHHKLVQKHLNNATEVMAEWMGVQ